MVNPITQPSEYLFVVNPVAGRGAGERAFQLLETAANRLQLNHQLVMTSAPGHATQLARQAAAAGCRVVIAVGGDGTSNEVLNGLLQASQNGEGKSIMGVIPVGRGNDFAAGLGLAAGTSPDPAACLDRLLACQAHSLDVGRVVGELYPEGLYFGNGVGIGFDAVVGFEALKLNRSPFYRLFSFATYLVAALRTIMLFHNAPLVRIETEAFQLEQRAIMISIMNGWRMGGLFKMAPQSSMQDGLYDICLVGAVKRLGLLGLIGRFMKGTQEAHPDVQIKRARSLRIHALQGTLPAHADGETLCTAGSDLMIELLPQALQILSLPGAAR